MDNRREANAGEGRRESLPGVSLPNLIKEEVQSTFGRKIKTARDCIQLSEEIFARTSVSINYNTLRRFFGIVRTTYPPSTATLTILANYCGFPSPEDMASYKQKVHRQLNDDEQSMVRFLTGVFKKTPTRSTNDETFLAVVRQAIDYVNDHPAIADKLQRAIARTPNGQDYYFEQYINIDKLNGHYGAGLLYYAAEKKTPEAQVFAHALLCQRGWLSDRPEEVEKHAGAVLAIALTPDMHPAASGRYFATRLFHADAQGLETGTILSDARAFYARILKGSDNYQLFPCFEYTYVLALVGTGHFREALFYLDHAFADYTGNHAYLDTGLYQTLHICHALALAGTGNMVAAGQVFDAIRPTEFYFLTRRTNTIQYLLLARELGRPIKDIEEQLEDLVAETGFVRLLRLFGKKDATREQKNEPPGAMLLAVGLFTSLVRETCMELEHCLVL